MQKLIIVLIAAVLASCSTATMFLKPTIDSYCNQPEAERLLLRQSVKNRLGHEIVINCEGQEDANE